MLQAEAAHFAKLRGEPAPVSETADPSTNPVKRQLENGEGEDEEDLEAKRRRILEETRDLDADSDDAGESDSSEDDRFDFMGSFVEQGLTGGTATTTTTRRPSCNESWRRSSARGLRRGNRRYRQAFPVYQLPRLTGTMQEREKAAAEEAEREHDIALGNPLLNAKSDFNVKRRYALSVAYSSERS